MERKTVEATALSSEVLTFTVDEATLGVRAVAYYVESSLQDLEANLNGRGFRAVQASAGQAMENINRTAEFVGFYQGLATKLNNAVEQPDTPVELSPNELSMLGDALFRLGNTGVKHARRALSTGEVHSDDSTFQALLAGRVEQTTTDAFDLFKKLEPIALSKSGQGWMMWDSPLPAS